MVGANITSSGAGLTGLLKNIMYLLVSGNMTSEH